MDKVDEDVFLYARMKILPSKLDFIPPEMNNFIPREMNNEAFNFPKCSEKVIVPSLGMHSRSWFLPDHDSNNTAVESLSIFQEPELG